MANIPWVEPKTIEEVKAEKINQLKQAAYNILKETDWYIVREHETGEQTPGEVLTYRQSVRDYSNQAEAEINGLSAVDEVKNYSFDFPVR